MCDRRPRRTCVQKQDQERKKELYRAEHAMCMKDFTPLSRNKGNNYKGDNDIEPLGDIGNHERTPSKRRITSALSSVGKNMYSFGCTQSPTVKVASFIRTTSTRSRRPPKPTTSSSRTPPKRTGENSNVKTTTRRTPGRTPRSRHELSTPHATRRKIVARLGKSKEETLNNREGSEDTEDDDEDEMPEEEMQVEDGDEERGDYFSQNVRQRRGAKATSDHTMSKLGAAMLSEEQISAILKNQGDVHAPHRKKILKTLCKKFPFWLQLTLEESNLLLYGLGSKTDVMSKLADFLYEEGYITMVIHGYLPTCGVQEIVNNILEFVIEDRPKGIIGLQAQVDFICKYFAREEAPHLFLLVNSIDAPALASPRVLQIFEKLASASQIHFVATVNHINAPLLFDLNRASAMRWIWVEAITYEPYVLELSSDSLKSSAANTLSSLEHVFASLTANAKKVFMVIANYTLDQCTSTSSSISNFRGMAFQDCYRICREAFVVNSDLTLRTQLTEFVDHDMVRIRKGHDGVEYLTIPLARETLEMFVKQQEQD